jgi:NAD(P)-dependent dehydrogenase (short-subunit alcohol dehydrogenase family)
MGLLNGKVAVITGATSGIGARTAQRFAAEGARVVLAGRREDEGEALAVGIGDGADFVRTDVSVESDVEALIGHAVGRYGRLDVMVNNAGRPANLSSIAEFDLETFRASMAVNVDGVLLGMKHAARQMIRQKSGSIINTTSISGRIAGWTGLDYATSKAAVIQLTRYGAIELGEHGVRVNSVSPGFVMTGIFAKVAGADHGKADAGMGALASAWDELKPPQSIPRPCTPDDIADAMLWLAGDAAGMVNGLDLVIDGGQSAGRPMSLALAERARLAEILTGGS